MKPNRNRPISRQLRQHQRQHQHSNFHVPIFAMGVVVYLLLSVVGTAALALYLWIS